MMTSRLAFIGILFSCAVLFVAYFEYLSGRGLRPSDIAYRFTMMEHDLDELIRRYDLEIDPFLEINDISETAYKNAWEGYDVKLKKIDDLQFARFVRAIKVEIAKVPVDVVQVELSLIFFVNVVFHPDSGIGGTYSEQDKAIFIVNAFAHGDRLAGTDFFKRAFHHELSSILMKNHNFDHQAWRGAYPEDFKYKGDEDFFIWL